MEPKTRTVLTLERITAETSHSASAVLAHIGSKRRLPKVFRACCGLATTVWEIYDPDLGRCVPDPEGTEAIWVSTRDALLNGIRNNMT